MKYVNMTVTVPRELREKMRKIKGVNWSEVARKAFEEEVKRVERMEAAKRTDALRTRVEGWSGEEEVRKWRDTR